MTTSFSIEDLKAIPSTAIPPKIEIHFFFQVQIEYLVSYFLLLDEQR